MRISDIRSTSFSMDQYKESLRIHSQSVQVSYKREGDERDAKVRPNSFKRPYDRNYKITDITGQPVVGGGTESDVVGVGMLNG